MKELPKANIYKLNSLFARKNGLPVYFTAVELRETPKAVFLYGQGTLETKKMGVCMACGRELTHAVSLELGIGPECGGHWHDWDLIGGYSIENEKRITQLILDIKIDNWIPKSCIKEMLPTTETVVIPKEHKMIAKKKDVKKEKIKRTVTLRNNGIPTLRIDFPFNYTDLEDVKSLSGRKFVNTGDMKFWTAPVAQENIDKLISWEFDVSQDILDLMEQHTANVKDLPSDIIVPGLKGTLRPFQQQGVAFLEKKNGRGLIADEMGLGKTIQALAWLQLRKEIRPAVIVVPATLKFNWQEECEKWVENPKVQVLQGKADTPLYGEIIIVNYDILPNTTQKIPLANGKNRISEIKGTGWADRIKKINPKVIIVDEAHKFKNNTARRTKAVKALAKTAKHFIALTGTPIKNRPLEIYNAISIIDPLIAGTEKAFKFRYCDAKHNGFGWDFSGSSNTQELHDKLINSIMIRRKKIDVLPELPAKVRSFIPMALTNTKEYNRAEADFINWVSINKGLKAAERAGRAEQLSKVGALKQLAAKGKQKGAIDWVNDYLEVNDKLVLFAVHKKTVTALMTKLKKFNPVKIDGSVSAINRDKAVKSFQNDSKCRVFIGNIAAAGEGITLTAASAVAFIELPWAPAELDQAEDRVHRIGQKADSVNIYYLLAKGTIEQKISKLLDEKRKVMDAVLDGKDTKIENLLNELIDSY